MMRELGIPLQEQTVLLRMASINISCKGLKDILSVLKKNAAKH
jgi:hypothetical protein